jgi:hypothetical protein
VNVGKLRQDGKKRFPGFATVWLPGEAVYGPAKERIAMVLNIIKNVVRILVTTDSEPTSGARARRAGRRFTSALGLEGLEGRLAPAGIDPGLAAAADAGPSITVTVTNQDDAPPVVIGQSEQDITTVVV